MWPASFWEKVYEPLIRRAAGLGRAAGGGRPRHLREGVRCIATCWSSAAGRGPDGGAGGRAGRRPRHAVRARTSASAAGCSPRAARIDDRARPDWAAPHRGGAGGAARGAHPAAHHRVRRLRPRHLCRAASASTITWRRRRRTSRASASGASSPSDASLPPAPSSGRWCSATTTAPASCWPARCAPISTATPWRPGRRAVVFANNDETARTVADLARAGIAVAARRRSAREPSPAASRPRPRPRARG